MTAAAAACAKRVDEAAREREAEYAAKEAELRSSLAAAETLDAAVAKQTSALRTQHAHALAALRAAHSTALLSKSRDLERADETLRKAVAKARLDKDRAQRRDVASGGAGRPPPGRPGGQVADGREGGRRGRRLSPLLALLTPSCY